jgi:hypothetical protein
LIKSLYLLVKDSEIFDDRVAVLELAASGCISRSFFVYFSYTFRALLKISWKLYEEEAVVMG